MLYIVANIPTVMGVYSTYSYLPAVSLVTPSRTPTSNSTSFQFFLQLGRDSGLTSQEASFLISMIGNNDSTK